MGPLKSNFGLARDEAELLAGRVSSLLQRGNFHGAHMILTMAEFSVQDKPHSLVGDAPLAQTELCTRLLNLLERHGGLTIGALANKGEDWILSLPGAGEAALKAMKKVLHYEIMRRNQ